MTKRRAAFIFAGAMLSACRPAAEAPTRAAPPSAAPEAKIRFIEDDYQGALSRARAAHLPLFVDAWAPWCHTCLSMKEYVFGDPALKPLVSKFVWAAIDTEKDGSAPFLRKFTMQAWPTLWVIDSSNEHAVLKWLGSATAPELATLLAEATAEVATATSGRDAGGSASAEAMAAWMRGNREAAAGHPREAAQEHHDALAKAPPGWETRPRVLEALVAELDASQQKDECLTVALREWSGMPPGTSRLNVGFVGLGCGSEGPARPEVQSLARALVGVANDPREPVLADDRSSLYDGLVGFYRSQKNEAEAEALARAWVAFLDAEAARAPTAAARAVFDSHRVLAYEAVGTPEKAIPMLERSERDFPTDYNPPARLASVYLFMRRFEPALAAAARAETKVYGPRTLRVLALKADILKAAQRPDEEKKELARAVRAGKKLELTGGYAQLYEQLKARAAAP